MGESPADLFGSVAVGYAKHRPSYPDAFFQQFADSCPGHELVWDCGCGNGQAALALTSYFKQVVATDASQEQLNQAVMHPQVSYRQAMADASGLADASVDGVVVAAAAHWLAGEQFNREVQRVARPGAVMAWIGYLLVQLEDPQLQQLVETFYSHTLRPWWSPQRAWVDVSYAGLPFPGEEWPFPRGLWIERQWQLADLIGYFGTWSAVAAAQRAGTGLLEPLQQALLPHWPNQGKSALLVRWPFMGRWGRLASLP